MVTPKYVLICLLIMRQINRSSAQVSIERSEPFDYKEEEHGPLHALNGHNKIDERKLVFLDNNPETFTPQRTSPTTNDDTKFMASSSIIPEEIALKSKQREASGETRLEVKRKTSAGIGEANQSTPSTAVEDGMASSINPRANVLSTLGSETPPLSVSSIHRSGNQPLSVSTIQRSENQPLSVSTIQMSENQLPSVSSIQKSENQLPSISTTQRYENQKQSVSSIHRSGNLPLSASSTQRSGNQPQSVSSTQRSDNQPPSVLSKQRSDNHVPSIFSTQRSENQPLSISSSQSSVDNSLSSSHRNYESKLQLLSQSQNGAAFSQIPSENFLNLQSAILNSFPRPDNDQNVKIHSGKELGSTKEVLNTTTPKVSPASESNYLEYFGEFFKNTSIKQQNNHSDWNHLNGTSLRGNDDENVQNVTADDSYAFAGTLERTEPENNTESIKIPFCCFDLKASEQCSQGNLTMPVAVDHCQQPTLTNVSTTPIRNLNCSINNRLKISLNTESKVIASSEARVLLNFNHRFISDFCIEGDLELASQWWAVVCAVDVDQEPEGFCQENKCFQKCCPVGLALRNSSCVCHVGKSILSKIVIPSLANISGENQFPQIFRYGMPNCNQPTVTNILDLNGKIDFDSQRRNMIKKESSLSHELSCVDDSLDALESVTSLIRISCREPKDGIWKTLRNVLIPAGLIVSCVFLLGTLTCHLCVAPLRDLHGLCLAAYMGALLVGDASLFTIKMYSGVLSRSACLVMGTMVHVSFLSTFMWLNIVCIDIWYYVGQTVQAVPLYRNPSDIRWFIVYGLYAWGCPIIFGGVIGGLQAHPANHNSSFLPDFAANSCWFNGDDFYKTLLFFYGPIGMLFIVNAYFIIHTVLRLYCLHSCCFSQSSYKTHQQQSHQSSLHRTYLSEFWERFSLFALLVCCWGTEFISWLSGSGDSEIWGLTDIINAFQGVFIFLIVLRSAKKRRLLKSSIDKWLDSLDQKKSSLSKRISFPQPQQTRHIVANLKNAVSAKKTSRNGILKDKLTETTSIDNIICKDAVKAYDFKLEDDMGEIEVKSQNPSSVWTIIPQWRSMKSRSYFINNGSGGQFNDRADGLFENLGDLQNIYLPSEREEMKLENHLDRKLDSESDSIAGWTLMKTRSGSMCWDVKSDIICKGLTKKDSK